MERRRYIYSLFQVYCKSTKLKIFDRFNLSADDPSEPYDVFVWDTQAWKANVLQSSNEKRLVFKEIKQRKEKKRFPNVFFINPHKKTNVPFL
jgi:hypothetical protein